MKATSDGCGLPQQQWLQDLKQAAWTRTKTVDHYEMPTNGDYK